jgi:hypothetical protein
MGGGSVATFASLTDIPGGFCLNSTSIALPGGGVCPNPTSGWSSSTVLLGPAPTNGLTVSNLAAVTSGSITGAETWLVAVIDNTTGATLLTCTVTASSNDSCGNATGSGTAAAYANLEVKITTNEILRLGMPWRVSFRY